MWSWVYERPGYYALGNCHLRKTPLPGSRIGDFGPQDRNTQFRNRGRAFSRQPCGSFLTTRIHLKGCNHPFRNQAGVFSRGTSSPYSGEGELGTTIPLLGIGQGGLKGGRQHPSFCPEGELGNNWAGSRMGDLCPLGRTPPPVPEREIFVLNIHKFKAWNVRVCGSFPLAAAHCFSAAAPALLLLLLFRSPRRRRRSRPPITSSLRPLPLPLINVSVPHCPYHRVRTPSSPACETCIGIWNSFWHLTEK